MSTTVQNIVDAVSQDVRKLLSNSGSDATILMDYVNRVNLMVLRHSRWAFLLSAPQRFITELDETDYWIGASGSAPSGVVDTTLNLTDIGNIKYDSVFDRSNFRPLKKTDEPPLLAKLAFQDAQSRAGRPALWRQSPDSPNVLNIYPAADNKNTYQPIPEAPVVSTVAGGAKAARTYYVRVTYVDNAGGESAASDEISIFVPANQLLVVSKPDVIIGAATGQTYNLFNVYVSTTSNTEQSVATNQSSAYTEPTTALVFGTAYPTNSTIAPLVGYVIEFRYYKARTQLTSLGQTLQIPDDYKDVVIAGVNYHTFKYLKQWEDAKTWGMEFQQGLAQILHDQNLFPQGPQFIRPDNAAVGAPSALDQIDPSTTFNA